MTAAPTVGRPAQGFTTQKAQGWVLAAAICVGMIYAFRRIIEPGVSQAPAKGSAGARLLGAGSPPPSLARWGVGYAASFVFLSTLTLAAPELAASLAMLMVAGSVLANGTTVVADLAGLEGPKTPAPPVTNRSNAGHGAVP